MEGLERILLLFVDGLGLPVAGAEDNIFSELPTLRRLLKEHSCGLDATLGVEGIPQSATGQTAIFTGVNAAEMVGRHVEGFPTAPLRKVIEARSLFGRLLAQGKRCCFANAYATMPGCELPPMRRSVTTVMTLAALGDTLGRDDLVSGRAVYHDLTRGTLVSKGAVGVPLISEEKAAGHLMDVFRGVDLCLFEYFLTDHAGHGRAHADASAILDSLDRFLEGILTSLWTEKELLLIVSDHGNVEDSSTRGHNLNRVPWIAYGCGADRALRACATIQDVSPAILGMFAD